MARVAYPAGFEEGHVYRILTLNGKEQYPREHILTYLGKGVGGHLFNARPFAGTQTFSPETKFVSVRCLGTSRGRDDPRHHMNKVRKDLGKIIR